MVTKEDVFGKVQAALIDALGVDDDEVTPEATLAFTAFFMSITLTRKMIMQINAGMDVRILT